MKRTIGVIGTGEIAHLHMQAAARLDWDFIGGYDINAEAACAFCKTWGGTPYPSAQALLDDSQIEIVYLCTRHDSHVTLASAACKAGKQVFLEKPVAMSTAEAEVLSRAHSANPVPFAVGYNMRTAPATTRLCELLHRHGAQPQSFKASMTGPPFMDGWASDLKQGGGVLVCQGSHMFDLIRYVLGSPVAAVCADTQHLGLTEDREPNAAALLLKLENGVCGTLLLHDRGTPSFHAESEGRMVGLTIYSPQGAFEADIYGKVRYGTEKGFFEELPDCCGDLCARWGYEAQAAEFGKLLDTGTSRLCTLTESVHTVKAVDAARTSAKKSEWTIVKQSENT